MSMRKGRLLKLGTKMTNQIIKRRFRIVFESCRPFFPLFRELFDDQYPSVAEYHLEVNVVGAKEVVTQLIIRYE